MFLPHEVNQPFVSEKSPGEWASLKMSAKQYFRVLNSEPEREEGMEAIYWRLKGREGQGRR